MRRLLGLHIMELHLVSVTLLGPDGGLRVWPTRVDRDGPVTRLEFQLPPGSWDSYSVRDPGGAVVAQRYGEPPGGGRLILEVSDA